MKKVMKIFMLLIVLITFTNFVHASEPEFIAQPNSIINVFENCKVNGFACDSAFNCNITITNPNQSIIVLNRQMTRDQTIYNYTLNISQTNLVGTYKNTVNCQNLTNAGSRDFDFLLTASGFTFETSDAILYTLIIIGSFLLFLFFLYLAIVIPIPNDKDDEGNIIRVTSFKYFKIFAIWFSHAFFVYFLTTSLGIINNFTSLESTRKLTTFLYLLSYGLLYPMTLIVIFTLIIFFYKDIFYNKQIRKHGKSFINQKL